MKLLIVALKNRKEKKNRYLLYLYVFPVVLNDFQNNNNDQQNSLSVPESSRDTTVTKKRQNSDTIHLLFIVM